jgi:arachidonate 5-lipoxygenase
MDQKQIEQLTSRDIAKSKLSASAATSGGGVQFDLYSFPFENIVFEGGSNNVLAYVGSVKCLEEAGVWSQVHRLAGSGTGALVAALFALNYNSQQVEKLINFDLRVSTQDHCCGSCCFCCCMLSSYGWNPNNKVIKWFRARVKESTGKDSTTFQQVYKKYGRELCIVVTNVSNGCVEYCHVKTTPNLSIVDALRMTLAAPGLCQPVKLRRNNRDQWLADGGIFYNFPIHCFDGWWLSLQPGDSFLNRHGLLNERCRLVEDPSRFAKFKFVLVCFHRIDFSSFFID